MIKFDLERAKKGHEVVTRDGRKVRIVATDCAGKYPLVCLVMGESGIEVVNTYNVDGTLSDSVDHPADLFMSPKKAKRYFNIYIRKDNGSPVTGECALTLDQSIKWATKSNHNLKFIRREIVEITL